MTDWTPTDEQIEKAAEEVARAVTEFNADPTIPHYSRHIADAVLVAVGPMIAAAAFDEGWIARSNREPVHRLNDGIAPPRSLNPYRQEAGR